MFRNVFRHLQLFLLLNLVGDSLEILGSFSYLGNIIFHFIHMHLCITYEHELLEAYIPKLPIRIRNSENQNNQTNLQLKQKANVQVLYFTRQVDSKKLWTIQPFQPYLYRRKYIRFDFHHHMNHNWLHENKRKSCKHCPPLLQRSMESP